MMEIADKIFEWFDKDPKNAFIIILILAVMYQEKKILDLSKKYISAVKDNWKITSKVNAIMGRLKMNSHITQEIQVNPSKESSK